MDSDPEAGQNLPHWTKEIVNKSALNLNIIKDKFDIWQETIEYADLPAQKQEQSALHDESAVSEIGIKREHYVHKLKDEVPLGLFEGSKSHDMGALVPSQQSDSSDSEASAEDAQQSLFKSLNNRALLQALNMPEEEIGKQGQKHR